MKINATFQGKQLAMEEEPCEVRKVISLPDKEYAFFKKHLIPMSISLPTPRYRERDTSVPRAWRKCEANLQGTFFHRNSFSHTNSRRNTVTACGSRGGKVSRRLRRKSMRGSI